MNVSLLEAEDHAPGDKAVPGIEQTDLATLVKHREQTQADTSLGEVYQQFQTDQQDSDRLIWWNSGELVSVFVISSTAMFVQDN